MNGPVTFPELLEFLLVISLILALTAATSAGLTWLLRWRLRRLYAKHNMEPPEWYDQ